MKKIIAIALAAITTLTASAKKTEQFSSVLIDAPVHLVILRAPVYSVNLMSRNNELTTAVSWKVKDGKLYLSSHDLESLSNSNTPVTVVVTAPEDVNYKLSSDVQKTANPKRPRPFFRR